MTGIILPPRELSPEEARGFRMACACFSTWGYQLVGQPRLAGPKASDDTRATFAAHGRFAMAMAAALDRQITKSIPDTALQEIRLPRARPCRGFATRLPATQEGTAS